MLVCFNMECLMTSGIWIARRVNAPSKRAVKLRSQLKILSSSLDLFYDQLTLDGHSLGRHCFHLSKICVSKWSKFFNAISPNAAPSKPPANAGHCNTYKVGAIRNQLPYIIKKPAQQQAPRGMQNPEKTHKVLFRCK